MSRRLGRALSAVPARPAALVALAVVALSLGACGGADPVAEPEGPDEESAAFTAVADADEDPALTVPAGPTTTFSPPTVPPATASIPSLPQAPPMSGDSIEPTLTATTVPLPPPVTLGSGTHLRPPGEGTVLDQFAESAATFCAEVDSPGWFLEQCEFAGALQAVVERHEGDGRRRAVIFRESFDPGIWRAELVAEDLVGNRWGEVVAIAADADGDQVAEVWVGYQVVGGTFDVDIVFPRRDGSLARAADHGLRNGRVVILAGGADTYEPVFLADDQPCCPTGGAVRREVRVEGAAWRATWLPPLPPGSPIPFSSFDTIASD